MQVFYFIKSNSMSILKSLLRYLFSNYAKIDFKILTFKVASLKPIRVFYFFKDNQSDAATTFCQTVYGQKNEGTLLEQQCCGLHYRRAAIIFYYWISSILVHSWGHSNTSVCRVPFTTVNHTSRSVNYYANLHSIWSIVIYSATCVTFDHKTFIVHS